MEVPSDGWLISSGCVDIKNVMIIRLGTQGYPKFFAGGFREGYVARQSKMVDVIDKAQATTMVFLCSGIHLAIGLNSGFSLPFQYGAICRGYKCRTCDTRRHTPLVYEIQVMSLFRLDAFRNLKVEVEFPSIAWMPLKCGEVRFALFSGVILTITTKTWRKCVCQAIAVSEPGLWVNICIVALAAATTGVLVTVTTGISIRKSRKTSKTTATLNGCLHI